MCSLFGGFTVYGVVVRNTPYSQVMKKVLLIFIARECNYLLAVNCYLTGNLYNTPDGYLYTDNDIRHTQKRN